MSSEAKNDPLYREAREADLKECPTAAIELFERFLKKFPNHNSARFRFAENLRSVGRLKDAEKEYLKVRSVPKPMLSTIELSWGELYMNRGDYRNAERYFREAVRLRPSCTIPWIYLGGCLARQGSFEEACKVFEKGLKAKGDIDEVYLNLGYNKRALKDYEGARNCFKKALQLDPNYIAAKEALKDIELTLEVISKYP